MIDRAFSAAQAAALAGVTYRQLDYWASEDIVTPTLAPGAGSGTQRRYAFVDVVALCVVGALVNDGCTLALARSAAEALRHPAVCIADDVCVVLDRRAARVITVEDVVELLDRVRRPLIVVPLAPFVEHVLDASDDIPEPRAGRHLALVDAPLNPDDVVVDQHALSSVPT